MAFRASSSRASPSSIHESERSVTPQTLQPPTTSSRPEAQSRVSCLSSATEQSAHPGQAESTTEWHALYDRASLQLENEDASTPVHTQGDSTVNLAPSSPPTQPVTQTSPATPIPLVDQNASAQPTAAAITPANINPAQRSGPTFFNVLLIWWPELIAATLALGILVTEIVLLAHYDGKLLLFHWTHNWQINAVFAFLTAFLEASLSFYPSGATKLIFRKGMHRQFAVVGAIIVVLLLGVGTFTQNIIVQHNILISWGIDDGWMPINTNYSWYDQETTLGIGDQQPLPQMVAAAQVGLYAFSSADTGATLSNNITTGCGGNKCEFGKYQTLAVCGQCTKDSTPAQNPCLNGSCTDSDYYTMSDGSNLSLVALRGVISITSDTGYPLDLDLRASAGPIIARMTAIAANDPFNSTCGHGAATIECAAWWCVQTYTGKVVNGTAYETVVEEWTDTSTAARTSYGQAADITLTPPTCWVNNTKPKNGSFCTYEASSRAHIALQNFITGGNLSNAQPLLFGSTVYGGQNGSRTWNDTSQLASGLGSTSIAK